MRYLTVLLAVVAYAGQPDCNKKGVTCYTIGLSKVGEPYGVTAGLGKIRGVWLNGARLKKGRDYHETGSSEQPSILVVKKVAGTAIDLRVMVK